MARSNGATPHPCPCPTHSLPHLPLLLLSLALPNGQPRPPSPIPPIGRHRAGRQGRLVPELDPPELINRGLAPPRRALLCSL